ncbi:coproporphyrinogen dehydrogenase HemZ [Heliobacterium gestii]|uniref:Coproporphyrinogen dehydrogenase HemZ n=1 Tax=Heliomicrobium gestii TaxID=2699 RepID=A0A845LCK5_HELGE|nr:coproporphyrinogen dehydrogenase HemZ [Heliomicrobium gestii]MBM7868077.1 oxygen-independent coproporphyrinogen-3 oxidase [Heliomicrobium gestii]MZP44392.1 coproporphyrinogen dehydrogenase HemZ [Heliomicrobium gestii]
MDVCLRGLPPGYGVTLQEVLWIYFPDAQFVEEAGPLPEGDGAAAERTVDQSAEVGFREERPDGQRRIVARFRHAGREGVGQAPLLPQGENDRRRAAKLALLRALEDYCDAPPNTWGILTGVRPAKIVHRRLDQGKLGEDIRAELLHDYALQPEKADLLMEIALRQRPFLYTGPEDRRKSGVYIGIPFCPTRCLYCSFPGYDVKKFKRWLTPFLDALAGEIETVGRALRQAGQQVQHIYIGGGTPTVLTAEQLGDLLGWINRHLRGPETVEFTLEAGRPDTLDRRKLEQAYAGGVNRLSINPQSMNADTLDRIGRCHRPGQVVEAVELARTIGFPIINMDLIVGLPGETAQSVRSTLDQLAKLRPENLTVHTMAIKRASRLTAERERWTLPPEDEVEAMLAVTRAGARTLGLVPYYLYRQKRILANQENVGYTLPGRECIYNIHVMEERQTIWGLGAGAATKIVRPEDGEILDSWHNPKDPMNYVERLETIIGRKLKKLEGIPC